MPMFRLIQSAPPETVAVEFHGPNAADAINVARRSCLKEADLWQEGHYLFTLRQHGYDDGMWMIYRKRELT